VKGGQGREFKGLLRAAGEMGCGNLKVITWDYEGDVGGCEVYPAVEIADG